MKNSLLRKKPIVVIKEVQEEVDWVNYIFAEAMKTIIKTSGYVFTITNKESSDPSKFIMPTIGPIGLGFLKTWGECFVMQVPRYFSIFSIR